jgi:hypothetical protein
MDIAQIGVAGIYAATDRLDQSANRTVSGKGEPVTEIVEQVSAKHALEASALVVKTADAMTKRLLDIKV